uniref:Glycosyl transferase n=1 Tax=uncultured bacterium CSLF42 TaxID=1091574 RepID=G4WVX5_9BACT|nr:glycosyl transferase [uncultured bacterium CSLF42]
MTHFGILTPPVFGHLHPFGALGRELQSRGHRVSVFHIPDLQEAVGSEGLSFVEIGRKDHPVGSLPRSWSEIGRLKGWPALQFTLREIVSVTRTFCEEGPAAIRDAGVGCLLVDQTEPAGAAMADYLGIPFVSICNALIMNRGSEIPPPFAGWSYRTDWFGKLRNRGGYWLWDWVTRPVLFEARRYQEKWGQRPFRSAEDTFSPLAQISQQPEAFDYPRRKLPSRFHYVGPLRRPKAGPDPFPWDRLDGRPIIYASLGTLQGAKIDLFQVIAEACQDLPVQLVMSHGRSLSEDQVRALPGNPLVVPYAPQWQLLGRTRLTVTHAGLNTVLDSLAHGVPLVAIPITYEQPAIAARIRWARVGQIVPLSKIRASVLRQSISQVLQEPKYQETAKHMAEAIRQSGGVVRAADIIESLPLDPDNLK